MKISSKTIGLIIFIALFLRGLLLMIAFQYPERSIMPDSESYVQPAFSMLQNGGQYTTVSALRTPLYPMFIALVYWLFGEKLIVIIVAQILIGTGTVILIYYLGLYLLPNKAAIAGTFLAAISIELIVDSFYVLTETLFTFLLLASLLTFTIYIKKESLSWLIISALLIALAILCRPIIAFFPVITLLLIMIFSKNTFSRVKESLIYASLVAAVLFPWVLRNDYLVGIPTISTISNLNLLYYNAVSLEANLRGTSEAQVRAEMDKRVEDKLTDLGLQDNEANRARVHSLLARQIIFEHPARYIVLHLKSDLNNLLPFITELTEILGVTTGGKGTASVLNQYGVFAAVKHYFGENVWMVWLFIPIILLLGLIYFGNLFAAFLLIKKHQWLPLAILTLPTMYLLLLPGAPSLPRFRVPAMPYLTLLAGYGLLDVPNLLTKFMRGKNFHRKTTSTNPAQD